jgi:hypothetical protein
MLMRALPGKLSPNTSLTDLHEAITVTHIRDEYGHLHHVAEFAARLLQSAIEVLKELSYLTVKVDRQRFTAIVHGRGLSFKPHRSRLR